MIERSLFELSAIQNEGLSFQSMYTKPNGSTLMSHYQGESPSAANVVERSSTAWLWPY